MTDKSTEKKDDRTIMNEEKEKRTKKEEKLLEDELVSTIHAKKMTAVDIE